MKKQAFIMSVGIVLLAFICQARAMSCSVTLNDQNIIDELVNLPETWMGYQSVRFHLKDGRVVETIVGNGEFINYDGPGSFTEADIQGFDVLDRNGAVVGSWP